MISRSLRLWCKIRLSWCYLHQFIYYWLSESLGNNIIFSWVCRFNSPLLIIATAFLYFSHCLSERKMTVYLHFVFCRFINEKQGFVLGNDGVLLKYLGWITYVQTWWSILTLHFLNKIFDKLLTHFYICRFVSLLFPLQFCTNLVCWHLCGNYRGTMTKC